MLRAIVRLTTVYELAVIALAIFIGVGFVLLVSAGMVGPGRTLVLGAIVFATGGLVVYNALSIYQRYRRLISGHCGHPFCHGVVGETDEHVREGNVICHTCRRVWPRLDGMKMEPAEPPEERTASVGSS